LMPSPRLELVTLVGYSLAYNDRENIKIELWQSKLPVKRSRF
jgi:hypothetical protein